MTQNAGSEKWTHRIPTLHQQLSNFWLAAPAQKGREFRWINLAK
jgi:hypothetical protein